MDLKRLAQLRRQPVLVQGVDARLLPPWNHQKYAAPGWCLLDLQIRRHREEYNRTQHSQKWNGRQPAHQAHRLIAENRHFKRGKNRRAIQHEEQEQSNAESRITRGSRYFASVGSLWAVP